MFSTLRLKEERLIIGLMSGTSCDGIDAALVRVKGTGIGVELSIEAFETLRFSPSIMRLIHSCQGGASGTNREVVLLDTYLGELFAYAALSLCGKAGVAPTAVDLIGSHGQTLYHHPHPEKFPGFVVTGSLQVGNPSVIAERTGITVVSDFRSRDMAAGGQGAPLAPLIDYVHYHNASRSRIVLNIGGIANVTILPNDAMLEDIRAFDTGPGNCLIDLAVFRTTGGRQSYDANGSMAGEGKVSPLLLKKLMDHPFLAKKPPKSVDKDAFGAAFLDGVLESFPPIDGVHLVATLTEFTVQSIVGAIMEFALQKYRCEELIVSGGGTRNQTVMNGLRRSLPRFLVTQADEYSIPAKAKEAVLMAYLANETIMGAPGNVPSATGAKRAVILGSITPGDNLPAMDDQETIETG